MNPGDFWRELKRRNVFKVAGVYAVAGWVLIQIAATTFPFLNIPDWCVRLVIALILLGFPIALILAWAFELTPEGVKRTEEVTEEQSITQKTGRKLNNIVIVLLVLAVGVLSYKLFFGGQTNGMQKPVSSHTQKVRDSLSIPARSIAVLPFVNDSGDSSDQYFSDGLSEELIIALSQYPGLRVIGRESSFQFRGRDLDSRSIGDKLKVAHLLEGSVSRDGNEVRVRAELVNATDGSTVWSKHYDRPYKNLFKLQDNITRTVASALKAKLLSVNDSTVHNQIDRPPSGNINAYNAYLQGTFYFRQLTKKSLGRAINYYKQAIRIDPGYTAAYARLSVTWMNLGANYLDGAAMQSARAKAKAYADTALSISPNSVAAHFAHGIYSQYSLNWQGAESQFRKAWQLAPSFPDAEQLLSFSVASLGRLDEAINLARKAVTANPLDGYNYNNLSRLLSGAGQLKEAEQAARRAVSLDPTTANFHAWLAAVNVLLHHSSLALSEADAEPAPGMRAWAITLAYTASGKRTQADRAMKTLIDGYSGNAAYQIAEAYAYRRQPDQAFDWLDRAWRQRDPGIGFLLYDPFLHRYHNDPRFAAFCKKVGLPVPNHDNAVSSDLMKGPQP